MSTGKSSSASSHTARKRALRSLQDTVAPSQSLVLHSTHRYGILLRLARMQKTFVNRAQSFTYLLNAHSNASTKAYPKNKLFGFFARALLFAGFFIVFLAVILVRWSAPRILPEKRTGQVAGVSSNQTASTSPFDRWFLDQTGHIATPEADEDGDGLTNHEEFLVGSNPVAAQSCSNQEVGDAEAILQLLHPGTCALINLTDPNQEALFARLVNLESVRALNFSTLQPSAQSEQAPLSVDSIQEVFLASSLEELDALATSATDLSAEEERLKNEQKRTEKKQMYLQKVARIDEYIRLNRSFEPYDRNYETPVGGAVYLQVAQQYDVPLKYVLAIAQRESRFGTDRYTHKGYLTRPGQYENIVSMGLDDEGNNLSFGGWAASVESFGKWYRRFDDAGVSDCAKWRIYNPNGDYCQRIEETASGIEAFLGF